MKKIGKFLKSNIKVLIAFIIGLIISGTTVYAATILFNSNQVGYDNTSSGMSATNVQDALDELYTKANSDSFWLKKYKTLAGTPTNYSDEEDGPTESSPTTPPLRKEIYVGLYAGYQYGVCIKRNGTQHCFRSNNWIAESKHIQEVFSDISCHVSSSDVSCDASDFSCRVESYGRGHVDCYHFGTNVACEADGDFGGCYR